MTKYLKLFALGTIPFVVVGGCGDERRASVGHDAGTPGEAGEGGHGGERGPPDGGSTSGSGGSNSGEGGAPGLAGDGGAAGMGGGDRGGATTGGSDGTGGFAARAGTAGVGGVGGGAGTGASGGGNGGASCMTAGVPLQSAGFDADTAAWIPHDDEDGPSRPVIVSAASVGVVGETSPNVAHLGGVNDGRAGMFQPIVIPEGAVSLTVTGYRWITTEELGPVALDAMSVELWEDAVSPSGLIGQFVAFGNDDASSGWVPFSGSVDVSGEGGRTVELDLWAETDLSLITEFFVDTLSLSALVCSTGER